MGQTSSQPRNKSGPSVVKAKIERAAKTGILSLSEHKLKEMPDALMQSKGLGGGSQSRLRTLDLSSNEMSALPAGLAVQYPNLKTLKAARNKIDRLPSLGSLASATAMDLSSNRLTADVVDQAFVGGSSPTLETLSLGRNPLGAVPRTVSNFPSLKVLDLTSCGLRGKLDWGEGILASLLELLLDENAIDLVPADVATRAPKLRRLALERNKITTLPAGLLRSPTLDRLDLKGNPLRKADFLRLDGVDDFLKRREKTRSKDIAGGLVGDLGVCGLDDDS